MFKKILIISIVVFIGIIVIGSVYLNNIYIPKHLKPMVIEQLEKNLAKDVEIEKAFYFPFKGVLFSGISVFNPDGSLFLEINKVDLSLKSFPKIRTNQANVKARLLIKKAAFNHHALSLRGSAAIDIDLEVIEGKDPIFNAKIKIDDLDIKGINNISDIEKINGEIICNQESFKSVGLNAFIADQPINLFLAGKYSKTDIDLEQLKIEYEKTKLELKAKINDFEKINIQAFSEGLIDLTAISQVFNIETLPVLKGECSFNFQADGPVSDLDVFNVKAHAEISQGAVDKIEFSDLKADINFEHSALNLAPLTCVFYKGRISAAAKAQIKDIIPINGSIDIEQVDIQPLIQAVIGEDMGTGQFNAHAGISGSAMDINNLNGSGWFKIEQASLKPPPRFNKVARTLKIPELEDMRIQQSSATFSLMDGKVQTEDFIAIADYATLTGKGYIDLEQYVDFAVKFKLSDILQQRLGGAGSITNNIADGAVVKLYDKIGQLKYKVDYSVEDVIKKQADKLLDRFLGKDEDQQNDDSSEQSEQDILKNQLKGLKKLFE